MAITRFLTTAGKGAKTVKKSNAKKVGWGVAVPMLVLLSAGATAYEPPSDSAYLRDASGEVVRNDYGECWRTGYWTPELAIIECDPDLFPPEPEAVVPTWVSIALSAEALFDFDRAEVRPESQERLNEELVDRMAQYPRIDAVRITGHTDRIGSDDYNQDLSERRATAVAEYLVSQGVDEGLISTAGRGELEPVVPCDEVGGRENRYNQELIDCLQPNRRVEVEVQMQEQQVVD